MVDNEIRPDPVSPPDVHQVIYALRADHDKISSFDFACSSPLHIDGSVFRAFTVRVSQISTVKTAYVKARQHVPQADHIMMAYRLETLEGSCDDGEHYGGLQILKTLRKKTLQNIAVFVARTKGDTNLGGRRFKAIQDVGSRILAVTCRPF